jgi:hypothetical protein
MFEQGIGPSVCSSRLGLLAAAVPIGAITLLFVIASQPLKFD